MYEHVVQACSRRGSCMVKVKIDNIRHPHVT